MKMKTGDLFDLEQTIVRGLFDENRYPWEVLPDIGGFILRLGKELSPREYVQTGPDIWIARDAEIAPSACICGPAIIDHGAQVRHCAYIRGCAAVGVSAVVGNSTELKNCVLFNGAKAPHFNYVGDSVLGAWAHLGAGAITSNVRFDRKTVVVRGEVPIDTGLGKLGAMVGDGAEVGCGSVLNPGTVLGRGAVVYPAVSVQGAVEAGCIVRGSAVAARMEA